MRRTNRLSSVVCSVFALLALAGSACAQTPDDTKLAHAVEVLTTLTADDERGIPADLLARARGVAVIPSVIRGGFIFGGRRGRGVLFVRTPSGEWSNPAFITLTGGSIGGQIGVESADVVLVFANDESVKNIEKGKFTLGGDATAVAGPVGRRSTKALTLKSEVYVYLRSRGLFAGAAFEGARLDVDEQGTARFYATTGAQSFVQPDAATPPSVRAVLATLEKAQTPLALPGAPLSAAPLSAGPIGPLPPLHTEPQPEEAVTFPLE